MKFAVAILLLTGAFACFYVAFHPGSVQFNGSPAKNPSEVIQSLIADFKAQSGASSGQQIT